MVSFRTTEAGCAGAEDAANSPRIYCLFLSFDIVVMYTISVSRSPTDKFSRRLMIWQWQPMLLASLSCENRWCRKDSRMSPSFSAPLYSLSSLLSVWLPESTHFVSGLLLSLLLSLSESKYSESALVDPAILAKPKTPLLCDYIFLLHTALQNTFSGLHGVPASIKATQDDSAFRRQK